MLNGSGKSGCAAGRCVVLGGRGGGAAVCGSSVEGACGASTAESGRAAVRCFAILRRTRECNILGGACGASTAKFGCATEGREGLGLAETAAVAGRTGTLAEVH